MAVCKTKTLKIDPSKYVIFKFVHLQEKECIVFKDKDVKDLLQKWSMQGNIHVQYYSYDQLFQPYQKNEFISDFLQDPVVISTLKTVSDGGTTCPVGISAAVAVITEVPCTVTSMSLFDRLTEEGIVRESGHIVKCLDEFIDDIAISDELRKMLLIEDSDNYEVYSEMEREEFLFRLFKHICLGGAICQYEDMIEPYLSTTKKVYKDLISVVKDSNTQALKVASTVLKIKAMDKDSFQFYPSDRDHEQTFAYFIIDPLKRHVAVLYHKWGRGVF